MGCYTNHSMTSRAMRMALQPQRVRISCSTSLSQFSLTMSHIVRPKSHISMKWEGILPDNITESPLKAKSSWEHSRPSWLRLDNPTLHLAYVHGGWGGRHHPCSILSAVVQTHFSFLLPPIGSYKTSKPWSPSFFYPTIELQVFVLKSLDSQRF